MRLGQCPSIWTFFFLKASLMEQYYISIEIMANYISVLKQECSLTCIGTFRKIMNESGTRRLDLYLKINKEFL